MESINFSKSKKLNKVLNSIYAEILDMHNTKEESIDALKHYVASFPFVVDYNLYSYGMLTIPTFGIREIYADYKSLQNVSDDRIIEIYKNNIRVVANYIIDNEEIINQ